MSVGLRIYFIIGFIGYLALTTFVTFFSEEKVWLYIIMFQLSAIGMALMEIHKAIKERR